MSDGRMRMRKATCLLWIPFALTACAVETDYSPLDEYEEVASTRILDAPDPTPGNFAPESRFLVERGEYMVELLGCGGCHTDGALEGAPNMGLALAGSSIGIAWTNPFNNDRPGVVYPPNLTPDAETGIGNLSDTQIAAAIRAGLGRHMSRRIAVMPWQGYARMTSEDVEAIVAYLRSIPPVRHRVPDEVTPGQRARNPYVYFGTYRSR